MTARVDVEPAGASARSAAGDAAPLVPPVTPVRCGAAAGTRSRSVGAPAATRNLERHERCADRDRVAGSSMQPSDPARERRRHLDGRFRRFDLDERLVQRDLVALGDEPVAHDGLLEAFAQIRENEDALGHQYATTFRTASPMRSTLGR